MADPSLWITDWDLLGVFLSQCSHSMSKSCLFFKTVQPKGPKAHIFFTLIRVLPDSFSLLMILCTVDNKIFKAFIILH